MQTGRLLRIIHCNFQTGFDSSNTQSLSSKALATGECVTHVRICAFPCPETDVTHHFVGMMRESFDYFRLNRT